MSSVHGVLKEVVTACLTEGFYTADQMADRAEELHPDLVVEYGIRLRRKTGRGGHESAPPCD